MAHCDFRGANLDEDDRISLGSLLAKWYIDDKTVLCWNFLAYLSLVRLPTI
jgi:hypothetical protein